MFYIEQTVLRGLRHSLCWMAIGLQTQTSDVTRTADPAQLTGSEVQKMRFWELQRAICDGKLQPHCSGVQICFDPDHGELLSFICLGLLELITIHAYAIVKRLKASEMAL